MCVNQGLLGQDVFKVASFRLEVKRAHEFSAAWQADCTRWRETVVTV